LREIYEVALDAIMSDHLMSKLSIQEKKDELKIYAMFESHGKKEGENSTKLNEKYSNLLKAKLEFCKTNHKTLRLNNLSQKIKEELNLN